MDTLGTPPPDLKTEIGTATDTLLDRDANKNAVNQAARQYHHAMEAVLRSMNIILSLNAYLGTFIYSTAGMVTAPHESAECVLDSSRTSAFLRGGYAAVKKAMETFPDEEIVVLDATAGPTAALSIPLAHALRDEKVRFIGMDISEKCVNAANLLVDKLELGSRFGGIYRADASNCELGSITGERRPHVVIVEAMQHGFLREGQLGIIANLKKQLPEDTLFVPHDVELFIELRSSPPNDWNRMGMLPPKRLKTIATQRQLVEAITGSADQNPRARLHPHISGEYNVDEQAQTHPYLYLGTEITTYPGVVLSSGASRLTSPVGVDDHVDQVARVNFSYHAGDSIRDLEVTRITKNGESYTRHPHVSGQFMRCYHSSKCSEGSTW